MLDPRQVILRRLKTIDDLPRLPDAVVRLEQVVGNPECEIEDVVDVLETDPAMSALLLKVANSAYVSDGAEKVGTLPKVVTRLGLKEVRRLCLAASVVRLFPQSSPLVDQHTFWHHSFAVATFTREIIRRSPAGRIADPDLAFVAGLLHDIGSLVLAHYFERLYSIIHREASRTHRPIHLVEQEYLRISHGEVGGILLGSWCLPEPIVNIVRHHHHPMNSSADHHLLSQVVHLADYICNRGGAAGPGECELSILNQQVCRDLQIEEEMLKELAEIADEEIERSQTLLEAVAV